MARIATSPDEEQPGDSTDTGTDLDLYDLTFNPTAAGKHGGDVFAGVRGEGPFHVIYADPPWPDRSKGEGGAGIMAPPYPTMSIAEVLSLPVASIAAPSALLLLWTPWAHLEIAMRTIRAWGFEYSTGAPWLKLGPDHKPIYGYGLWFRHCTELLLLARRGNTVKMFSDAGLTRTARGGLFIAERRDHSRKPDEPATWIETTMPGPRVELFARVRREGWTAWGNQVPPEAR